MVREKKPGRGSDQFPLRLPDGMRERLKDMADFREVSMNQVIVDALEEAFPPYPTLEVLAEQARSLLAAAELDPRNAPLFEQVQEAIQVLLSTASLERPLTSPRKAFQVLAKHGVIQNQTVIPNEPTALLASQYEFGLARLEDVPDEEKPAARERLLSALSESAELLGVDWTPPKWDDEP